jgi:protein gp37
MGESTRIEWADATFNAWVGCSRVSRGCTNCYAERQTRHWYPEAGLWGPQGTRRRTGDDNWKGPLRWNQEKAAATFLKATGHRRRVFCGSLCDIFEDHADLIRLRAELWALIAATVNLDWLLLTKRPENIGAMAPPEWTRKHGWPTHVWLGTSAEDQATADRRLPDLLQYGAPVLFLSAEPLLGPIELGGHLTRLPCLDWVICGGESGPGRRPMNPDWARALRDECAAADTAFFFKQHNKEPNDDRRLDGELHERFPEPRR